MSFIFENPSDGTSGAFFGASSVNFFRQVPEVSLSGLNDNLPPRASATISSGLPIKSIVSLLPSFRPGKFRLNEVIIVLGSPGFISGLCHCPMHGPHAFANTVAPTIM